MAAVRTARYWRSFVSEARIIKRPISFLKESAGGRRSFRLVFIGVSCMRVREGGDYGLLQSGLYDKSIARKDGKSRNRNPPELNREVKSSLSNGHAIS
jgi:hypothetical protein